MRNNYKNKKSQIEEVCDVGGNLNPLQRQYYTSCQNVILIL